MATYTVTLKIASTVRMNVEAETEDEAWDMAEELVRADDWEVDSAATLLDNSYADDVDHVELAQAQP